MVRPVLQYVITCKAYEFLKIASYIATYTYVTKNYAPKIYPEAVLNVPSAYTNIIEPYPTGYYFIDHYHMDRPLT